NGYHTKDKKKTNKTEHGMEKTKSNRSQSQSKSKSQQEGQPRQTLHDNLPDVRSLLEDGEKEEMVITEILHVSTELEQESIKKQKVDEDKETTELQKLIKVVPNKVEVTIDAIP
ncbi:hypothetical protein Tco_0736219, partial [Tanacetum coccineum]